VPPPPDDSTTDAVTDVVLTSRGDLGWIARANSLVGAPLGVYTRARVRFGW
jgi:hypothetical protein